MYFEFFKVKPRYVLFLIFITISSQAQLLIGPSVGGQYSWTAYSDKSYKDLYKVSPVLGFHAGAQVSFRVHKRFFLHSSLLYSRKGKILEGIGDFSKLEGKYALEKLTATYNYIELPIIYTVEFKVQTKGGKLFKWYMGGGPNISYWLNGKGTIVNTETREPSDGGVLPYKVIFNKPYSDVAAGEMVVQNPNRLQLGINFMVGLVFEPIRNQEMMLSLRYELGHTNLSQDSFGTFLGTVYQDNLQIHNQGPRLSLAYLLDTKLDQRKKGKSTIKRSTMTRKKRRR